MYIDHRSQAPHAFPAISQFPDKLYVVTAISNPMRYHSRYRLYHAFEKYMADSGAILYTAEMAYGGRDFEVTNPANPRHIRVRSDQTLWHKENLLNIAISRLPADAKYIAYIDADFTFMRPDWAQETLQQLQHFKVVQLFSDVYYCGPNGVVLKYNRSFMGRWTSGETLNMGSFAVNNKKLFTAADNTSMAGNKAPVTQEDLDYSYPTPCDANKQGTSWGAPGGAWAFRRDALDALGGLIDYSILGSADYFMAAALVGKLDAVMPKKYSDEFKACLKLWETKAERHIRRNVGLVEGSAHHAWHGKFSDRGYSRREQIHYMYKFNPNVDIKKDSQGLYVLNDDGTERYIHLRDEIHAYMTSRNEDSIDT